MTLTWLEINIDNLLHNIKSIQSQLQPNTILSPVIKSNAYGHGLEIAKILHQIGIDRFCVTSFDEAIKIGEQGIDSPVLILGPTDFESLEQCAQQNIEITIYSLEQLQKIQNLSSQFQSPLKFHLKIDTGMTRLGVHPEEITQTLKHVAKCNQLALSGVYTHFADADNQDQTFTKQQFQIFQKCIEQIKNSSEIKSDHIIYHCSNSAATLTNPDFQLDMVRPGLAIYGYYPSQAAKQKLENQNLQLKPVLSFKTRIASLKWVPANTPIGYGRSFTTTRPTLVGVIPTGYADGLNRQLSNKGFVLVHGQQAPILGKVCMNMTMIDLTNITNSLPQINDIVTIIGQEGANSVSAEDHANWANTIPYEILTSIPNHLPNNNSYMINSKPFEINHMFDYV